MYVYVEVGRWSKKGKFMSTYLLNDPILLFIREPNSGCGLSKGATVFDETIEKYP